MKRYNLLCDGDPAEAVPSDSGIWVLHSDAAAAMQDARRYRWLRERNEAWLGIDPQGPYAVIDYSDDSETVYPRSGELDAAIDAQLAWEPSND